MESLSLTASDCKYSDEDMTPTNSYKIYKHKCDKVNYDNTLFYFTLF